jgi:DNA polymerase-4
VAIRDDGHMAPWVLHVDMDQFIAAVEVLRRPELVGRPVIVGGRGDPTERGVVSTASYEARAFGVRSGMPLRIAVRRCPDAVVLPVDHRAYDAASDVVMATLRAVPGAVVEVLGWDEAFVGVEADVPEDVARRIQADVLAATALHCSVGIGDTKVRAKIATEFGKPQGMYRLTRETWFDVMGDRPTRDLWGVGPRISQRLARLGIETVRQLARAEDAVLAGEFGPGTGPYLGGLGRGEGSATVDDTPWVARGHSRETTFQQNLVDRDDIEAAARELLAQVLGDVAEEGRPVVGLGLKVRYAPFLTKTFTKKIAATHDRDTVVERAMELVAKIEPDRPVRLLGMRAEMAMPDDAREGHTPTRSGW